MSIGAAVRRVATATSVVRTRQEDAVRRERHGDHAAAVARLEKAAVRLERAADELERIAAEI